MHHQLVDLPSTAAATLPDDPNDDPAWSPDHPKVFFNAPSGRGKKSSLTFQYPDLAEVEANTRGSETRVLFLLHIAWRKDPEFPASSRGRRTYTELALLYGEDANSEDDPLPSTMSKYIGRIQRSVNIALRAANRPPLAVFQLNGSRGVRLAIRFE